MLKKIILLCLCMPLAVQATDLKDTPKCNDKRVLEVLSGAFAQQGKATGVNMAVNAVEEIKQTADYPAKKIRFLQCLIKRQKIPPHFLAPYYNRFDVLDPAAI